jgi:hypothetical protein
MPARPVGGEAQCHYPDRRRERPYCIRRGRRHKRNGPKPEVGDVALKPAKVQHAVEPESKPTETVRHYPQANYFHVEGSVRRVLRIELRLGCVEQKEKSSCQGRTATICHTNPIYLKIETCVKSWPKDEPLAEFDHRPWRRGGRDVSGGPLPCIADYAVLSLGCRQSSIEPSLKEAAQA